MQKIRITHKDGDMQGITLMYLINKYLKINRELWDKEDMVLNRYYKAILTRTIKSMITDVVNAFKDFKTMWIREIDDSIIRLEEQL